MGILGRALKKIFRYHVVSDEQINSAIDNKEMIYINYKSFFNREATGGRVIEVFVFGLSSANNKIIRVFQPQGDTSSSRPAWKILRTDGITSWKPLGKNFYNPPQMEYAGTPSYKEQGDRSFKTIFNQVSFGNNPNDRLYKTTGDRQLNTQRANIERQNQDNKNYALKNNSNNIYSNKEENGPNLKNDGDNSDEVYKTQTELNLERLRKQLENNPRKINIEKR